MPANSLDDLHAANRASVRRQFEELWNNGRVELIGELFDKEFMNFEKQHHHGHALVKNIVGVWRSAFPDLRFMVDSMVDVQSGLSGNAQRDVPAYSPSARTQSGSQQ